MSPRRGTFLCPHCGADVAARALACPECGSDASSGWSEHAEDWAGDLPSGYGSAEDDGDEDEEEAYQDFLRREGLAEVGRKPLRPLRERRVAAVCLLIVACIVLWLVLR